MPVRDDKKRMEFLRSLSVEDLANRRITEYSSEQEKQMIHEARDIIKEKNDARYLKRHEAKSRIDLQKATVNDFRRRGVNELVGKEGGLTGGVVGQYLLPALGISAIGLSALATKGKSLKGAKGKLPKLGLGKKGRLNDMETLVANKPLSKDDRQWLHKLLDKHDDKKLRLKKEQRKQIDRILEKDKVRKSPLVDQPATHSPASVSTAPPPSPNYEQNMANLEKQLAEIKGNQSQLATENAALRKQLDDLSKNTGHHTTAAAETPSGTSSDITNWKPNFVFDKEQLPKEYWDRVKVINSGDWQTLMELKSHDEQIAEIAKAANAAGQSPEDTYRIAEALTNKMAIRKRNEQYFNDNVYKIWNDVQRQLKKK